MPKIGFIHIPKCAGTSVRRAIHRFAEFADGWHDKYCHAYERMANCDVVLAVVRNPYSRHISQCKEELAHYTKQKQVGYAMYRAIHTHGFLGILKLSREEIRAIMQEEAYGEVDFCPFDTQLSYISDEAGRIYDNVKIFRQEDGMGPIAEYLRKLGFKIRERRRNLQNTGDSLPWQTYYHCEELKQLVTRRYHEDFETFRYAKIA